jgi:mono/diheme cytochrome c family protein
VIALALVLAAGLPPKLLSQTGLYADIGTRTLAPGVLAFTPQYPLWTDGASKQRWIHLPEGSAIDARDPDAWVFPIGTRVWKEFSFGRAVETRLLERGADGRWSYASYAWNADGSDAQLVPERGLKNACQTPAGTRHDIPGRNDCRACHEAGPNRVLGFGALQLSPDRDPLALHAETPAPGSVDLPALIERGLLRGLPQEFAQRAPRIPARSPRERAALGYLQANCSHCHDSRGELAPLGLHLDNLQAGGHSPVDSLRPRSELLLGRMGTREPLNQMPPLGTHLVDAEAFGLIRAWIREELGPGERDPFQTQAKPR